MNAGAVNLRLGYGLALLAALFWAGTGPLIGLITRGYGVPPLTSALWRDVMCAAALLAGVLLFRRQHLRMPRASFVQLCVIGALGIGIYHYIWALSIQMNGASLATVLVYLYVSLTAAAAWLFYRERIGLLQFIALALSLLGCVLAVRAYDPAVLQLSWAGILVGIGCALSQTAYVLLTKRAVATLDPFVMLAVLFTAGAIALAIAHLVVAPATIWAMPHANAWLVTLFLAIVPTIGGYIFYSLALKHIPARVAALIAATELIWASIVSYLLLGETLLPIQIIGCGLVFVATMLSNVKSKS